MWSTPVLLEILKWLPLEQVLIALRSDGYSSGMMPGACESRSGLSFIVKSGLPVAGGWW